MDTQTVLITGGTGLIGAVLSDHLANSGYDVIVLTRDPGKAKSHHTGSKRVKFAKWDVEEQTIDQSAVESADAIIHLAGAGVVDKAWTDEYKKVILESRTNSSALIVKSLLETVNKVKTVISASAIGWYGEDKGDNHRFQETDPPANDFLGQTCKAWEASIKPVKDLGRRLAIFRFGVVLSKKGGALAEFIKPLNVRVASVLGDGNQMISWISIKDLCKALHYAIENPDIQGVYNAVTPFPVSNEKLVTTLGKIKFGNSYLKMRVPAFVIKTMLGDRSAEVLKSATVSSQKLEIAGFQFDYPTIQEALQDIIKDNED